MCYLSYYCLHLMIINKLSKPRKDRSSIGTKDITLDAPHKALNAHTVIWHWRPKHTSTLNAQGWNPSGEKQGIGSSEHGEYYHHSPLYAIDYMEWRKRALLIY